MTVPVNRNATRIGPFVAGERPDSFAPTLADHFGNPLTGLTGWAAMAVITKPDGTATDHPATIVDDVPVMPTWPDLDDVGTWYIEMWIGNGALRYASDLYVFDVGTRLGENPPAV